MARFWVFVFISLTSNIIVNLVTRRRAATSSAAREGGRIKVGSYLSYPVTPLKPPYSAGVHPNAIGKPVQKQACRTIILYIQTGPINNVSQFIELTLPYSPEDCRDLRFIALLIVPRLHPSTFCTCVRELPLSINLIIASCLA